MLLVICICVLTGMYLAAREAAQRRAVDQTAAELVAEAVGVSRAVQSGACSGPGELQRLLERVRQESPLDIVWVKVTGQQDANSARAGKPPLIVYPVWPDAQPAKPAVKTVRTAGGPVLVASYPMPWPARGGSPWLRVVAGDGAAGGWGVIEIAARVGRGPAAPRRGQHGAAAYLASQSLAHAPELASRAL